MKASNLRRSLLLISFSAFVAACGGGGGGSSAQAGSPSPLPGGPSAGIPSTGGDSSGDGHGGGTIGGDNTGGGHGGVGSASALLTWEAPTTNVDGSCLQDLQAYRVNFGLNSGQYTEARTLEASEMSCSATGQANSCGEVQSCTVLLENIPTASWYFAVQAVDAAGNASGYSNEMVKTIQ